MRDELTDDIIAALINAPKFISEAERRKLSQRHEKDGRRRVEIKLVSDAPVTFRLFICDVIDAPEDFSVGLNARFADGSYVNLIRCNGSHGIPHKNRIERDEVAGCHIHKATERYIRRRCQAEGYAEHTDAYRTIDGALEYMLTLGNIAYEFEAQGGGENVI